MLCFPCICLNETARYGHGTNRSTLMLNGRRGNLDLVAWGNNEVKGYTGHYTTPYDPPEERTGWTMLLTEPESETLDLLPSQNKEQYLHDLFNTKQAAGDLSVRYVDNSKNVQLIVKGKFPCHNSLPGSQFGLPSDRNHGVQAIASTLPAISLPQVSLMVLLIMLAMWRPPCQWSTDCRAGSFTRAWCVRSYSLCDRYQLMEAFAMGFQRSL